MRAVGVTPRPSARREQGIRAFPEREPAAASTDVDIAAVGRDDQTAFTVDGRDPSSPSELCASRNRTAERDEPRPNHLLIGLAPQDGEVRLIDPHEIAYQRECRSHSE